MKCTVNGRRTLGRPKNAWVKTVTRELATLDLHGGMAQVVESDRRKLCKIVGLMSPTGRKGISM